SVVLTTDPVQARSVDNLSPKTPTHFNAAITQGGVELTWEPSTELDLAGYQVHRGPPGFSPDISSLIHEGPETKYVEPMLSDGLEYRLLAMDRNGNASDPAIAAWGGVRDIEFAVHRFGPNPARDAAFRI